MMEERAKRIKTYSVNMPSSLFGGRCYHAEDKSDNTFGWIWAEWFAKNLFAPLAALARADSGIDEGEALFGF